jgi:hypothetical protein
VGVRVPVIVTMWFGEVFAGGVLVCVPCDAVMAVVSVAVAVAGIRLRAAAGAPG